MLITETLEYSQLEKMVRYGSYPDTPGLVDDYLEMSRSIAKNQPDELSQHNVHYRVANTLLDTICDTYIPSHWRRLCLNHIYQPVFAAEKLAHTSACRRRMMRFRHELVILGNYFL